MSRTHRTDPSSLRASDFESFVNAATMCLGRLQRLLREAFESSLPSGTGARACGRSLGLGRTLGWQAWSLAYAPDAASALARLPGLAGWKLLLAAFAKARLPAPKVEALAEAVREMHGMLSSMKTSASVLRSMAAGGLSTTNEAAALVRARRNARTAAETMHGVRCGLNAVATIVGPADRRSQCDLASASLFAGLQRLRPGLPWAIYRWGIQAGGGRRPSSGGKALSRSNLAPLVPDLSTPGIETGALRRVDGDSRSSIEFVDAGGIRARSFDATFIESSPKKGRMVPSDEVHAIAVIVTVPLQHAVVDLLLHRDVPHYEYPTGAVYSAFDPMMWVRNGGSDFLMQESCRIPLEREPKPVDSLRLPSKWGGRSSAYLEAVRRAARSLGYEFEDFKVIRLELPDPPLHGVLVIRWRCR